MRRTDLRWVLAAILACGACDEAPLQRHEAPNENVMPAAGKSGGTAGTSGEVAEAAGAGGAEDAEGGADGASGAGASDASGSGGGMALGTELEVRVTADEPTFVSLSSASTVMVSNEESSSSTEWDLRFQGWDIFSNGGASGGGKGASFGPLPLTYFLAGTDPTDVPFLIEDKAAGAFRDWFFYDGQWHTVYSRFHVYGVKSGPRLFKVQLLGYYGDVQGAPISALYRLRYAEVTPESAGLAIEVKQLDATAGGLGGDASAASGYLSLRAGEQEQLSPLQAAASTSWDLGFRRDSVSVNGGRGGPGAVSAVDLDAAASHDETLEQIEQLSAENQAARFASIDHETLTAPTLKYRGDRVVSAFTDAWVDVTRKPPALADDNTWLVVGADGKSRFLLVITALEHSTTEAAGAVVLRILQVR
jgi:hypothetical protein